LRCGREPTAGGTEMWIGLFAIVIAIAICFGVAAFVMQPATHYS
jgi:hypothetical protein